MKQNDDLAGEGGTVGTAAGAYRAPDGGGPSAKPLTLPPGTTLEKFQEFMKSARDIVGDDNATVISSEHELKHESYLDPSKAYDVGVVPLTVKDSQNTDKQSRCSMLPQRSTSSPLQSLLPGQYLTFKLSYDYAMSTRFPFGHSASEGTLAMAAQHLECLEALISTWAGI